MVASVRKRPGNSCSDLPEVVASPEGRKWCVCDGEREKQAVGVAFEILMMQFPLRGGPPICEQNRQNLAKNGETEIKNVQGGRKWGRNSLHKRRNHLPRILDFFLASCKSPDFLKIEMPFLWAFLFGQKKRTLGVFQPCGHIHWQLTDQPHPVWSSGCSSSDCSMRGSWWWWGESDGEGGCQLLSLSQFTLYKSSRKEASVEKLHQNHVGLF